MRAQRRAEKRAKQRFGKGEKAKNRELKRVLEREH